MVNGIGGLVAHSTGSMLGWASTPTHSAADFATDNFGNDFISPPIPMDYNQALQWPIFFASSLEIF